MMALFLVMLILVMLKEVLIALFLVMPIRIGLNGIVSSNANTYRS